jgi:uncharacterized protein (TIGR03435 family)
VLRFRVDWFVWFTSLLWCVAGGFTFARVTGEPRPSQSIKGTQSLAEMMAAGATLAFDVASVKPDTSNIPESSRFPLGPGDAYLPGGIFSATNQPLIAYLRFAHKLSQGDLLGLPGWIYTERFDIEARALANPTKDQMRLMMQSLLAGRFTLRVHTETRIKPVLNLGLAKAGKTGPQLRLQPKGESCDVPSPLLPPIACGSLGPTPASVPGQTRLVGRRVTMRRISEFLMNPFTGIDRPVVDRTGLRGEFESSHNS